MAYLLEKRAAGKKDLLGLFAKHKRLSSVGRQYQTAAQAAVKGKVVGSRSYNKALAAWDANLKRVTGHSLAEWDELGALHKANWGPWLKWGGIIGGGGLGAATLVGYGRSLGRSSLNEWQRDPSIGAERFYTDSKWKL